MLGLIEARDRRKARDLQMQALAAGIGVNAPKEIDKIKPVLSGGRKREEYRWWVDGPPSE